jgi:hypothetical protein
MSTPNAWQRWFPILSWGPRYKRTKLTAELFMAVTRWPCWASHTPSRPAQPGLNCLARW